MKKLLCLIVFLLMASPVLAADVKISDLPTVTSVTPATDTVIVNVSGATSKITVDNLRPAATEIVAGISERCTNAEMTTGTKTDCDVTPANAKVELDKKAATAGSTSLVSYGPTALQSVSCTDSGNGDPGAVTITPTAGLAINNISLTVLDAHGCTVTMAETSQVEGQIAIIRNISVANTATFTTTTDVLYLTMGSPFVQAAEEVLILQYQGSRWLEIGRRSGTVKFSALDMTSGTSSIPMTVGTADPGAVAGTMAVDTNDTGSNSGGSLEWHDGAQVRNVVDTGTNYTIITKTEFLPIGWAVNGATAPAAIAAVTGKEVNARAFTEADDVVFWWIVPNDYVGGVKYRVLYALSANASADDTAVFSMTGSVVANSGDLDGGAGTALTVTDELTTDDDQYQLMISDYSAESNADWSLAAGAVARLNFSHAAASDMVGAGEPLVIGIEIKYKAKIIGFGGY